MLAQLVEWQIPDLTTENKGPETELIGERYALCTRIESKGGEAYP